MKRRGLEPMHSNHVNVTPLIDVIMCLIIFFLLCGQLAKDESSANVRVPRADLGQDMPELQGRLLINLVPRLNADGIPATDSKEPEVFIHGSQVQLDHLTAYLQQEKQENPDVKVVLRADRDLTYDWISPVLVSCAQANIQSVNFSTQKH
jgi:biopolymer transport protein ExbD